MLKHRIQQYIFLFPIFIVYTFCLEGKYYKKSKGNSANNATGFYVKNKYPTCTLLVQGIECELCKQSVCTILEQVGAEPNSFEATMAEESRIIFSVKPHTMIDIVQLQQKLNKEGFAFKNLTGSFDGTIKYHDDQIYFELVHHDLRLKIKNPGVNMAVQAKSEILKGMITYDSTNKHFWLTLL